ncbi:SDR family oxidoreductase [Chitinophaga pendula]|uniref:SDR family oxidoreductase n=1 Tax=Chitinophaga TaxID=79328 RepID=UPI000BAF7FBB|nr:MULTISPECIES: SDR family oxidoreductase [Chitinophaga]ASZ13416.1 short-chain dehydrogenase/reductase [Chitinophaga sp. MD30]UCJ08959.1 SDR family oxidoreductase [Chitinophaga pendula]
MSAVVLITGASSGLGETIANYLADKGYIVYGTSRNIHSEGRKFHTLQMDVGDPESIRRCVQHILHAQARIDVLINNAGLSIAGVTEHLLLADVQQTFDTNLFGVIRVCQEVLPYMRAQQQGRIINISSIGAEIGLPYRGIYSASKAALDRFTEALRLEVAPFGIQACSFQPGAIKTGINQRRLRTTVPTGSPYQHSFESTYAGIDRSIEKGSTPLSFCPVILHIIRSKHIKRCYRVGTLLEKIAVLLKQLLPATLFERLISRYYQH